MEWISVKDRLPKDFDIFRVRLNSGEICKAYFHKDGFYWRCYYGHPLTYWEKVDGHENITNLVTHWQDTTEKE